MVARLALLCACVFPLALQCFGLGSPCHLPGKDAWPCNPSGHACLAHSTQCRCTTTQSVLANMHGKGGRLCNFAWRWPLAQPFGRGCRPRGYRTQSDLARTLIRFESPPAVENLARCSVFVLNALTIIVHMLSALDKEHTSIGTTLRDLFQRQPNAIFVFHRGARVGSAARHAVYTLRATPPPKPKAQHQ